MISKQYDSYAAPIIYMMHFMFCKNDIHRGVILIALSFWCALQACKTRTVTVHAHMITIDQRLFDSVKNSSDSSYSKPYFSRDFVTAIYFINRFDSTVAQVMKDKDSVVRQILITKGKRKIYAAHYYPNGQLIENVQLDGYGQPDGTAVEYYANGVVKRSGAYRSGLHQGMWQNFDSMGKLLSPDEYGKDGEVTVKRGK